MKRTRKLHPADAANAETLRRAVRFDVALFLGTGRYARASAATLDEARIEAMRLKASAASSVERIPGLRQEWLLFRKPSDLASAEFQLALGSVRF